MNLELFNLRQLQDTKTFLTLCEAMPINDALQVIEQEIANRTNELPDSKVLNTTNPAPIKSCPSCGVSMREENKGGEFIWHCLECHHSEYIGIK